jgi:hypothetical protein
MRLLFAGGNILPTRFDLSLTLDSESAATRIGAEVVGGVATRRLLQTDGMAGEAPDVKAGGWN